MWAFGNFNGTAVRHLFDEALHHAEVRRWRKKMALQRTLDRRPELLAQAVLDADDRALLDEIRKERTEGENDERD